MAIVVQCRCGRKMRVRDSAAGKRIKCPNCGKPVTVPEPEIDEYDDLYDDLYDDQPDPYSPPPPPRSRPPKKNNQSKKKKSSGGNLVPLLIVGIGIAGAVFAGGLAYSRLTKGTAGTPVAATDTESGNPANAAAEDSKSSVIQGERNGQHDASSSTPTPTPTSSDGRAAKPSSTAASSGNPGDMWVVLSDFRKQTGSDRQNDLIVSYHVAAGQVQSGQKYVLFVGSPMGMLTQYREVDLDLNNRSGTVVVPASSNTANLTAHVALKIGHRDWQPVSGEIEVGGATTAARRPPTVQESAGSAAQGKMVALANGRFEKGRIGASAIVVDYVMQQQFDHGFQYFLVIKGEGEPVGAMITTSLMRATIGEKDELGVRQMGRPFPSGNLTVQIVKKMGMLDRNEEVVSNTISITR